MKDLKHFELVIFFRLFMVLSMFICEGAVPIKANAQKLVDYSSTDKIKIDEPSIATLNITGVESLPTSKTDDLHAWAEYTDETGNYFKKRIILNAQGASSLQYPKKNLSIKFCEDEWVGESTTSIQIGNWVKQDAFHYKASWIDSFRGGLAVATSYKLYEDIVADETTIQERAGLSDFSTKALCHPDGFPCVISLNGQFMGIYAWQLKKHRKNMDMDKDNPKHVWFQLETYTSSLNNGQVIWDDIEIENPKDVTDESKQYIEKLALYHKELQNLESNSSADEMREEISKRFDIISAIDFYIHGLMISNIDGFAKNAHYFTYDGIKWFVMPYDLDETFGNSWIATFQFPASHSLTIYDYTLSATMYVPPFYWILKYYWSDICTRYETLRNNDVITTANILSHLKDWNNRVGSENYNLEYSKWSNCSSNGTTIINDSWEYIEDWSKYSSLEDYSESKQYVIGDYCRFDYRVWKAKRSVNNECPLVQSGYTDTEERVQLWLDQRIKLEDSYFGYKPSTSVDQIVQDKLGVGNKKVIINGHLLIGTSHGMYTTTGIKLKK